MVNTKCNHQYFDEIDNEIKSYLLGFFIADGWLELNSNRFGVSIQEEDNHILEYYKQNICDNKICTKNRTTETISRKNQSTFRWSSEYMKNIFIENYNVKPNKTYDNNFTFPFEKIPEHLIRHFIRGFIDGDGCFESNKGTFTITLLSTSNKFLNQISNYICNLDKIEPNIKEIKGKTINWFTLRFNMFRENKPEKVLKIYNYLYQDSTIFLPRKKEKVELYLKYRGKL